MTQRRPACKDFIVPAIRATRRNAHNLSSGTAAGIPLKRLFNLAREAYSPEEFHDGLQKAIRAKSVVVVARTQMVHVTKVDDKDHFAYGERNPAVKVTKIPSYQPRDYRIWYLNDKGKSVEVKNEGTYRNFADAMIYVAEDGLPLSVVAAIGQDRPKTAHAIIASIQRKKRRKPAKKPAQRQRK